MNEFGSYQATVPPHIRHGPVPEPPSSDVRVRLSVAITTQRFVVTRFSHGEPHQTSSPTSVDHSRGVPLAIGFSRLAIDRC